MWLHATVVSAWRVFSQPLCLLLRSTAGFLAAQMRWREGRISSRRALQSRYIIERRRWFWKPTFPSICFFHDLATGALRQVNTGLRSRPVPSIFSHLIVRIYLHDERSYLIKATMSSQTSSQVSRRESVPETVPATALQDYAPIPAMSLPANSSDRRLTYENSFEYGTSNEDYKSTISQQNADGKYPRPHCSLTFFSRELHRAHVLQRKSLNASYHRLVAY